MRTGAKFRGQHINSCSRVIHMSLPANKIKLFCPRRPDSNGLFAGFARAYAHGILNRGNKNF
ncbi:MAG TPA: hypothetical protein VF480_04570, partial [Verrucomicrobiae bacterium]